MSERRQPAAPRRADAARRSDFHLPPVQIPMIRDESTWYLNWVALAPYFPDCRLCRHAGTEGDRSGLPVTLTV